MKLRKSDFARPTAELAKDLLGCFLVHATQHARLVGRIVETEAYLYRNDPACHAHRGMTKRNKPMFGPAGRSYVYLIYGMYYCFNVTSGNIGEGEAVLIRALEPIAGIDTMSRRRGVKDVRSLCSGPGKLTQAMGISLEHNDRCLRTDCLSIHTRDSFKNLISPQKSLRVLATTRIGIGRGIDLPLRFLIKDNPFVSKPA